MAKFIVRRLFSLVLTLLVASMAVFAVTELMPSDLANKVLGQFATLEQKERWRERNGMNQPAAIRYVDWLVGSDWRMQGRVGKELVELPERKTGDPQWWALDDDGSLVQWTMEAGELMEIRRLPAGEAGRIVALKRGAETYLCQGDRCTQASPQSQAQGDGVAAELAPAEVEALCAADTTCISGTPARLMSDDRARGNLPVICRGERCWQAQSTKGPAGDVWQQRDDGAAIFWGVDTANHVVLWQQGAAVEQTAAAAAGQAQIVETGGLEYHPLQRGLLRGDPGRSFLTGRAVSSTILGRLLNSAWLAGIAFLIIMPLALLLGILAGLSEGKLLDRLISITGLITTATPEFTTGVLLILVFVINMKPGLPGAVTLMPGQTVFSQPKMLILPVLTLMLAELGYVARMTRASVVEVMSTPYVRTAILKGLPRWHIITRHVLRNALIAPITVIMLHVNWLIGGIVVVEALFGFPGLGTYLLEAALFGDVYAIEAGAMVMVTLAVGTQFVADLAYTFLNPRIRYA